uniref:Platelet endothelial aggregation receptor 1 n=1 Tax=Neovison vison TaxID=452646 RepID=A0A8C7C658_NEOVI
GQLCRFRLLCWGLRALIHCPAQSFTTITKESHSRPFSLLPSEPCDRPWESPHACPQPTVVYRPVYRQVVRTEHRKRLRCCQGFYESGDTCVPLCAQECVHGRCVAPGRCQCEQGWCREECPVGRFGQDCAETCDCAQGARCFPANGACLCEHGFTGDRCTEPCPLGHWGADCAQSCQCGHGGTCHPQDGSCFCPPGWTGRLCLEGTHGRGTRALPPSPGRRLPLWPLTTPASLPPYQAALPGRSEPTAPSHASAVQERGATPSRGPVCVPQRTAVPPAGLVSSSPGPPCPQGTRTQTPRAPGLPPGASPVHVPCAPE